MDHAEQKWTARASEGRTVALEPARDACAAGELRGMSGGVSCGLTALAITTICSFVPNPWFPENEIFPYFLAPALLAVTARSVRAGVTIAIAAAAAMAAIFALTQSSDVVFTDSVQLVAVAVVLVCVSRLDAHERAFFARRLQYVLFAVIGFMALQRLFPPLVDFVYQHLVRRQSSAGELQAYTGGVPGIAPEPAYMGAYLIGGWLACRRLSEADNVPLTVACMVGVSLSASLSAAMMLSVLLGVELITSLRRLVTALTLAVLTIAILTWLESSLVERFRTFVEIATDQSDLGVEALTAIDGAFGSMRLSSLVTPLSDLGCGAYICGGSYTKGYSLLAVIYGLWAPFHLVCAVIMLVRARDRIALSSAVVAAFYGPVLNWSMYAGLLRPASAVRRGCALRRASCVASPPRASNRR